MSIATDKPTAAPPPPKGGAFARRIPYDWHASHAFCNLPSRSHGTPVLRSRWRARTRKRSRTHPIVSRCESISRDGRS